MTDVHYKIRHTKNNRRVDEFVKLPPVEFDSCRAEQLFLYCVDKGYDVKTVTILENARAHSRVSLLSEYQNWLRRT